MERDLSYSSLAITGQLTIDTENRDKGWGGREEMDCSSLIIIDPEEWLVFYRNERNYIYTLCENY